MQEHEEFLTEAFAHRYQVVSVLRCFTNRIPAQIQMKQLRPVAKHIL